MLFAQPQTRFDTQSKYGIKRNISSNENGFVAKRKSQSKERKPLQDQKPAPKSIPNIENENILETHLRTSQKAIEMNKFCVDVMSPSSPAHDGTFTPDYANLSAGELKSPPGKTKNLLEFTQEYSPSTPHYTAADHFFTTPTPFKTKRSDGAISEKYRAKLAQNRIAEVSKESPFLNRLFAEEFSSPAPIMSVVNSNKTEKLSKSKSEHSLKKLKLELEESQSVSSLISNLKTEACKYLHSGQFDLAIETALACLQTVNSSCKDQLATNADTIYVKILLGEAYTHSGLFQVALDHLLSAKTLLDKNLQLSTRGALDRKLLQQKKYSGELLLYCMLCYDDLAYLYRLQDDLVKAKQSYETSLQIKLQIYGENSIQVATAFNYLGLVYTSLGNFELAMDLFMKSLKTKAAKYGERHIETATLYNNLGNIYLYIGDFEKALEHYQMGKEIIEQSSVVLGSSECSHPDLATCYNNIGTSLKNLFRYEDAIVYYEKSQVLREKILGSDHTQTAACYILLGNLYADTFEYGKALEYLLLAKSIREKLDERAKAMRADSMLNLELAQVNISLGSLYTRTGEYTKALAEYKTARVIVAKTYGEHHLETLQCDESIGNLLWLNGNSSEALTLLLNIIKTRSSVHGNFHPSIATMYNNIANIYRVQGKFSESLQMYRKAQSIYESIYGKENESVATVYTNIANLFYANKKQIPTALKLYSDALAIRTKVLGEAHLDTIHSIRNMALIHQELKKYDIAYKYAVVCKERLEDHLGKNHPETKSLGSLVANILRASGGVGIARKKVKITKHVTFNIK